MPGPRIWRCQQPEHGPEAEVRQQVTHVEVQRERRHGPEYLAVADGAGQQRARIEPVGIECAPAREKTHQQDDGGVAERAEPRATVRRLGLRGPAAGRILEIVAAQLRRGGGCVRGLRPAAIQ